jgi:hypothetical protein
LRTVQLFKFLNPDTLAQTLAQTGFLHGTAYYSHVAPGRAGFALHQHYRFAVAPGRA